MQQKQNPYLLLSLVIASVLSTIVTVVVGGAARSQYGNMCDTTVLHFTTLKFPTILFGILGPILLIIAFVLSIKNKQYVNAAKLATLFIICIIFSLLSFVAASGGINTCGFHY